MLGGERQQKRPTLRFKDRKHVCIGRQSASGEKDRERFVPVYFRHWIKHYNG